MPYTRPAIVSGVTKLHKAFFENLFDGVDEKLSVEDANATYAPVWADERDGGLAAMQKLRFEQEEVRFGLAGDSTGNSSTEWFDLAATALGVAHPALRVEVPHWNDTTQAWDAATVVQAGTTVSTGVKARDTFTRTGDVSGSTPDLGLPWTNDGSNALGDWAMDGSKAVATAETVRSTVLQDMQVDGEMEVRIDFNISTVTASGARSVRFLTSYKSATDHIFGNLAVNQSTGAVTLNLNKRLGNVVTKISPTTDPTSAAIAANTANQDVTSRIKVVGNTVTFTLTRGGTTDTLTGTLTEPDLAAIAGAKKGGVFVSQATNPLPFSMDLFEISLLTAEPSVKATFWNSSVSGSTLAYQESRIATLFPEPLDVLLLSAGHNYSTDAPEVHQGKVDAFVAAFHAVQPGVPIVITGQNPQFAPSGNRAAHNKRQSALKSYCRSRGFGYIPNTEKWLEQANKGSDLVQADGIHPTVGSSGTGSSFWRDRVLDYLNAL